MSLPTTAPEHLAGSDEPESFAILGWRLATLNGCTVCDRPSSPESADCAACSAALASLVLEERSARAAYVTGQVGAWKDAGLLSTSAARRVWRALEQAEPALLTGTLVAARPAAAKVAVAPAAGEVVAAPAARAQASPSADGGVQASSWRPPSWGAFGESLLAERTLNTLLGLGAFLILAAALVISVFNPTRLALAPHLGVLAGTMALFYVAGYVCYARLRLTRGGEALLAIVAAFVPLEVWTLGGADGLGWSGSQLWVVGSALALPLYAVSYWCLPGRAFAVLLAVAGASLPLSLLALFEVSPDWILCTSTAVALGYVVGAARLRAPRWHNLRRAALGAAHVMTPPVLMMLLAAHVLGGPAVPDYAVGAAWWLGVGMYAATAYLYRWFPGAEIAAWLAPVAYYLTLTRAPWAPAWYGVWFVGLGAVYALIACRSTALGRRHAAGPVAVVLTIGGGLWAAHYGVTWAFFGAVLADGVLAGVLAVVFRRARVGFGAGALLAGAYWLALLLVRWPNWSAGDPWPWLVLAVGLGIGAEAQLRVTGEHRRPWQHVVTGVGAWRAIFAPAAFDAMCLAGLIAVGLALVHAASTGLVQASAVLTTVGLMAVAVTWMRRASVFLYPASVLVAMAVALAMDAFADERYLRIGLALAIVGAAYGLIGRRLEQVADASYRRPLWVMGLLLSVVGPALALGDGDAPRRAVVATAGALGFAAVVAIVRHPIWAYPVGLWVVASYELVLLAVFPDLRAAYYLGALVLPSCLGLVIAEWCLPRARREPRPAPFAILQLARARWALPPLTVGLAGFVLSMSAVPFDATVGAIVPTVYAVALAVMAMRHGDRPGERWIAPVLLGVAVIRGVDRAGVGPESTSPFLIGFAVALALLSLVAARGRRLTVRAWRMPLEWIAIGSAAVGEILVLGRIWTGSPHATALSTALCALAVLTLAYARRARLLAYVGVAALVVAALMEIAAVRVSQLQAYALPVGVYLLALAWLEWRLGDQARLKAPFEIGAVLVLLGATLLQGLGWLGDAPGSSRYPYDVALILEGLLVLGIGAGLHWWRSLFAGAGAVVLAVLILLAEPLATVNTWYLVGSLGLLLMGGVVLLERRRQQIPVWLDGWRERLEPWG